MPEGHVVHGVARRIRRVLGAGLSRSRTSVGALLMDQTVVAGVGNVFRAEALFRARVSPLRLRHGHPQRGARRAHAHPQPDLPGELTAGPAAGTRRPGGCGQVRGSNRAVKWRSAGGSSTMRYPGSDAASSATRSQTSMT